MIILFYWIKNTYVSSFYQNHLFATLILIIYFY